MKIFKRSLTEALIDPEAKGAENRTLGSVIIAFSGILLFSDKILEALGIEGCNTFGFTSFSNFVWVFTQSIAPVVMIIGFLLRPYIFSLLIPIYCYTIQIIWIFHPDMYYDDPFLHAYATGACLIFSLLMLLIFLSKYSKYRNKKYVENKMFLEEIRKTVELLKQEIKDKKT